MATRITHVEYGERPISSQKYEAETDNIFDYLNYLETNNLRDTPPATPVDGMVWTDNRYSPPLTLRFNSVKNVWEWTGLRAYGAGTSLPSAPPSTGAIRFNVDTGRMEIWDGTAWVVSMADSSALTSSTSGGTYIWNRKHSFPDNITYPVLGYGYDKNDQAYQNSTASDGYRDILVLGGDAKPWKSCLLYSVDNGSNWYTVMGMETLAETLDIDPELIVSVETIEGHRGDGETDLAASPFIFSIINLADPGVGGKRVLVAIRVTDTQPQDTENGVIVGIPAGTAVYASVVSNFILPHHYYDMELTANGLAVGCADDTGVPAVQYYTWNADGEISKTGEATLSGGVVNEQIVVLIRAPERNEALIAVTYGGDVFVNVSGTWTHQMNKVALSNGAVPIWGVWAPWDECFYVSLTDGSVQKGVGFTTSTGSPTQMTWEGVILTEQFVVEQPLVSGRLSSTILAGNGKIFGAQYGTIYQKSINDPDFVFAHRDDYNYYSGTYAGNTRSEFYVLSVNADYKLVDLLESTFETPLSVVRAYMRQIQLLTELINNSALRSPIKKGAIIPYVKDAPVPEGWVDCDGTTLPDGTVVPDLNQKIIIGTTEGDEGEEGGSVAETEDTPKIESVFVRYIMATRDFTIGGEGGLVPLLNDNEIAAIRNSDTPGENNPFLTAADIPRLPQGPQGRPPDAGEVLEGIQAFMGSDLPNIATDVSGAVYETKYTLTLTRLNSITHEHNTVTVDIPVQTGDNAGLLSKEVLDGLNDAIDLINSTLETMMGQVLYLPATNFNTATPTQAQITAYAESVSHAGEVRNGMSVINTFNNTEWIYNADAEEWVNIGQTGVSTATQTDLGVVKGSTGDWNIKINNDGTMSVHTIPDLPIASTVQAGIVEIITPEEWALL